VGGFDLVFLFGVNTGIAYLTMELLGFPFSVFNILLAFSFVLFFLLFDFCCFVVLTLVGGQTVDKMVYGFRIKEFEGSSVTLVHAVIRTVTCVFSLRPVGRGLVFERTSITRHYF